MRRGPGMAVRVLCVDDNHDVADSTGLLLQLLGCEVRVCYDGPTAVAVAAGFGPDLCLLDLNMPGMHGDELAGRLRGRPDARPPYLVCVTARDADGDRRRTNAAGFHQHLVKPVGPAVLTALVRAVGFTRHGPGGRAMGPDERAAELVGVVNGHVELRSPDGERVVFGPYPNPAIAKEKADAARRFVAAVLRAARPAGD